MALFSRRCIQRLINESVASLTNIQRRDLVGRLNGENFTDALAAEWELVLLDALSKVGRVEHQPDLGGRTPDIVFYEKDVSPLFVADITSVSQRSLEAENPIEYVFEEVQRIVPRHGLDPSKFRVDVGVRQTGYKRGPNVALALPKASDIHQAVLGAKFKTFLAEIRAEPMVPRSLELNEDEIDVRIGFDPAQKSFGGGYPSFTHINDPTRNPLANALKKKAAQLKHVSIKAPKGIFLCDGGARVLSRHSLSHLSYSADELILDFLHGQKSIAFVVLIVVEREGQIGAPYLRIVPYAKGPLTETPGWFPPLQSFYTHLPKPETDARGAISWLQRTARYEGRSKWGGMEIEFGDELRVKISSRALLSLLSGLVTVEEFSRAHTIGPSNASVFERAAREGKLIRSLVLEPIEDDADDQWVTLVLVGSDPAVSPFVI